VYVAVFLFFDESGLVHEVVIGRMLQYKETVVCKETGVQDLCGQGVEPVQGVGRVGEHQIERLGADAQKVEYVVVDDLHPLYAQGSGGLFDEGGVGRIHFHSHDIGAAAGGHLIADAAGAGKKVQESDAFKVGGAGKHIEQTLLGKVRRGPCGIVGGGIDALTPEGA